MNELLKSLVEGAEAREMSFVIASIRVRTESEMRGDVYIPMKIDLELAVIPGEFPVFMPEEAKLALRILKVIKE